MSKTAKEKGLELGIVLIHSKEGPGDPPSSKENPAFGRAVRSLLINHPAEGALLLVTIAGVSITSYASDPKVSAVAGSVTLILGLGSMLAVSAIPLFRRS